MTGDGPLPWEAIQEIGRVAFRIEYPAGQIAPPELVIVKNDEFFRQTARAIGYEQIQQRNEAKKR